MSDAKIEIKAGGAEFSATGNQDWVAKQLDKFFANAGKLAAIAPSPADNGGSGGDGGGQAKPNTGVASKPLAIYLKEQGATTSQVKKFYTTAVWLHAKGAARLTTTNVTQALKAANQSRLSNPADCLNQNVSKGLCEKDGKQFFVTA